MVKRLVVTRETMGSSPILHPMCAFVAQLVEAIGLDPIQCEFESHRRYQIFCRPSPIGRGMRFKPSTVWVRVPGAVPIAAWQRGYAPDCNPGYAGSIPVAVSIGV